MISLMRFLLYYDGIVVNVTKSFLYTREEVCPRQTITLCRLRLSIPDHFLSSVNFYQENIMEFLREFSEHCRESNLASKLKLIYYRQR